MYPTINQVFELSVEKYSDHEGMVYPQKNQRWSYSEWDDKINRVANGLRGLGIGKGDVVSAVLYNTSEFLTTLLACSKIGALFNPINYRLSAGELAFITSDAGSKALVFEEAVHDVVSKAREINEVPHYLFVDDNPPEFSLSFYSLLNGSSSTRPEVEISQEDRYIIMYTSGTTGKPKGVVHRHRDMIEHNMCMIADQKLTHRDRGLSAAPLNHSAELHCLFLPRIHIGATNVLIHHFDPIPVLECIQNEKITIMFGAPTMWNMMLQQDITKFDLSSFRLLVYGGAPMAPALVRQCHKDFGCDLLQYYGMTEMGPATTVLYPEEQLPFSGAAGRAILNHQVRVVRPREDGPSEPDNLTEPGENGEIIVRGPACMEHYYNRPEATERALYKGWYHTGDIGSVDEQGYIWVADRVDDMIISGGENIYPREVEDVLYEHPDVVEVAVVGLPDPQWGKIVVAFVVSKNSDLTAKALDEYLLASDKLASFKRPRRYEFIDELPKTASGKIQKFVLAKEFATEQ